MNESEDLKKIDEIIKKHKVEARDPDELEYAEFIDCNDQDEINELEDYEIPDYQKLDITQFNTYVPTHFLTDEEKRIIESCKDPELKQLLLLNRNKNIQLIDLYSKVKDLLLECQENINVKQEFIDSTKQTKRVCNKIWRLGIPYFKTKDDFPCPRNEDVIRKHNNGELFFYEMTPSNKWLEKDMNRLLKGISFHYKVLKEKELEQAIKQLETEMKEDTKKDIEKEEVVQELKNKFEDLRNTETDMYPPLEEYNCLDWNRIAEMFLKEKYSAQDCQIFWNIYLHPSINKGSWCEAENDRLKALVVDYNQQNWDLIAAELGNNRTGFIACVHYFSKLNPVRLGRFTNAEDKLLFHLVDKYQQGEYIPWTKIAQHFIHRTRGQLFNRYKYFLSCRNGQTKGKFSEAEDILILVLVDRFGKKFTKCAEYFPNRSVVQIKARYTSNLRAGLKKGSFNLEEDKMILNHIKIHGTSNWEPLVKLLGRCGAQIRQRYTTLNTYFKTHPNGEVEDAPRRKFLVMHDGNSEYCFLRHMADKFKNCQKIPTLQDVENILMKSPKPNAKHVEPKTYKRKRLKIRRVEEINEEPENQLIVVNQENPPQTCTKEESKEPKNVPPKFRPKKSSKNKLLLLSQEPEEVIDCDETFTDVKLSVDDLLVDFFSSSIKLNLEQSANKDHIRQATNTISFILSSLQVQLAIPKNYKIDQRLDAIDLEILKNLTRNGFFIHRNSTNIDWLIPPNLNTVVGIRSLIITNQIYRNERKEKKTHIFDKFNADLKGNQIQWCINNHLSNQSDHSKNEIMAERNMFFQRFVALYKIPAIMTLQAPSEQLENCLTNLGDQFTTQVRKYEKRNCPVVQNSDPTAFEEVFIKQQPFEEECEKPTITMAERLKRRIQETLLDLTKAPPKKKFYKDTLEVMPKTTYFQSYSENFLESSQTIVISDDIDTPVETQQVEQRQDFNPIDPLKEAKRTYVLKQELKLAVPPKETEKSYMPKQVVTVAVPPEETKKTYMPKQEVNLAVPPEETKTTSMPKQTPHLVDPPKESKKTNIQKQDLNPIDPLKEAKRTYVPKQQLNLVQPQKKTKKSPIPKQEVNVAAPPEETKKTYIPKQDLNPIDPLKEAKRTHVPKQQLKQPPKKTKKSHIPKQEGNVTVPPEETKKTDIPKQDLNPVERSKTRRTYKRKPKATSTGRKKTITPLVKSEVGVKTENCTNLYPGESETHSCFNLGKGELILENDSPRDNRGAGSFVDQDLLDLDALNKVLKKEKHFVDESFDF